MRVGLESPSYSRRRSHPQRSGPQDQSTPSLNAPRSPPPCARGENRTARRPREPLLLTQARGPHARRPREPLLLT